MISSGVPLLFFPLFDIQAACFVMRPWHGICSLKVEVVFAEPMTPWPFSGLSVRAIDLIPTEFVSALLISFLVSS